MVCLFVYRKVKDFLVYFALNVIYPPCIYSKLLPWHKVMYSAKERMMTEILRREPLGQSQNTTYLSIADLRVYIAN